jgi:hypothetical protein
MTREEDVTTSNLDLPDEPFPHPLVEEKTSPLALAALPEDGWQ